MKKKYFSIIQIVMSISFFVSLFFNIFENQRFHYYYYQDSSLYNFFDSYSDSDLVTPIKCLIVVLFLVSLCCYVVQTINNSSSATYISFIDTLVISEKYPVWSVIPLINAVLLFVLGRLEASVFISFSNNYYRIGKTTAFLFVPIILLVIMFTLSLLEIFLPNKFYAPDIPKVAMIQTPTTVERPTVNNTIPTADELKKYKELLDDGAITQEEFDTKKAELLGLK